MSRFMATDQHENNRCLLGDDALCQELWHELGNVQIKRTGHISGEIIRACLYCSFGYVSKV